MSEAEDQIFMGNKYPDISQKRREVSFSFPCPGFNAVTPLQKNTP
jgi:hypothetical protein